MTRLDLETLRDNLEGRMIGAEFYYHQAIPSTMDETHRLALSGAVEGIVVIAEDQTHGRGRFEREWISPVDVNLAFSVLFRPHINYLAYMNMAATLAVCATVDDIIDLPAKIKWPNDVQINGKKLAGILIENEIKGIEVEHAVVGIGMNVNLDPSGYSDIEFLATSLFKESGRVINRTDVLSTLLKHLDRYYSEIKSGLSLTQRWANKIDTIGKSISIKSGADVIEGIAESVDGQGSLSLRKPNGSLIVVSAGEVTLQV